MYFWAMKAIASGLLGTASATYIKNTRLGKWAYRKFEAIANKIKDRYGIDMLDQAEYQWRSKYPKLVSKIDELETRIKQLEGKK